MLNVELFVQGVVQGAIYALIALGLTLVYGLLRILHIAHAGLFTLGGYLGVIVVLITALQHGLSAQRRRRLIEALEVPAQTLWRWHRCSSFAASGG